MARIGIDARFLLHGVGRYVEELLTHLARLDTRHAYHVFTRRSRREPPPLRALWGDRFFEIAGKGSLYGPAGQLRIPYQSARRGLELFHATSFPSPLLRVCPLVVTIHDQAPRLDRRRLPFRTGLRGFSARAYYDFMNGYAMRSADHIITVSEQARRDILRFHPYLPAEKISVIYHGISETFAPADGVEQARVRTRHRLPESYFLYLGTVNPGKNLVRVLEAFDALRREPGWTHKLVAVARRDPRYEEFYRYWERYPGRDAVVLLDYVDKPDLPGLYSGAHALVFPSEHESFGFPLLEAFACGTPVITSNVSALPETAGGAALLVDPYSVHAIASACRELARNEPLRRELIAKGMRRTRDFSWLRCAEQTLAVYEGVLSGRLH